MIPQACPVCGKHGPVQFDMGLTGTWYLCDRISPSERYVMQWPYLLRGGPGYCSAFKPERDGWNGVVDFFRELADMEKDIEYDLD